MNFLDTIDLPPEAIRGLEAFSDRTADTPYAIIAAIMIAFS